MDLKKGTVVCSKAGHDKGDFQVIMDFDDKYVIVCDGKYRPISRPKKKKIIHVKATNTVLNEEDLSADKTIRKALQPFVEASQKTKKLQ